MEPKFATATLAYDELPEGSALRRQYDPSGAVTILAPAGELPPSMRRAVARAGLVPASVALALCLAVVGLVLVFAIRGNRLEASLRPAAVITLGVLGAGVFLFVWVAHHAMVVYALQEARRDATVLHADATRLVVETTNGSCERSLDVPVGEVAALRVGQAHYGLRESAPVPCLELVLCDGSRHFLMGGHHETELRWVAASLSDATGIAIAAARSKMGPVGRIVSFFRADLPFAGRVGG